MSATTQEELLAHSGHSLSIYYYGDRDEPASVTIECDDCNEVLLSIDNDDVEPDECTTAQLKYKRDLEEEE